MITQSKDKGRTRHGMEQGLLRIIFLMTDYFEMDSQNRTENTSERIQYSLKVYSEVYYSMTAEYNIV